jgi:nucleotide-binding universal stress UspA family protein
VRQDPIVAGTDGSPRAEVAVDKAGELAQALGVSVHVVCVPGAIAGKDWPQRITAQQIVADASDRLSGRGITVQTHLPKDEGDAALTLVAVAEGEQAQMIVVGNRGMTGSGRVLGSLPNRVSHRARCDVLIVPTKSRSLPEFGQRSIVVGTDGSSRATRAVRRAIGLAKALGGDLHIVSSSKSSDSSEPALAEAATEAGNNGVNAVTHAREDDPADALLDVADKNEAVIVVVGSKGMHADEREWFGNIPDKLSHSGASSVLIVYTAEPTGSIDDSVNAVAAAETGSAGEDAST